MLDGITDIVDEVHVCRQKGLALPLRSVLEELGALCSPRRVQELLDQQIPTVSGKDRRRATCLLRKAAIAAKTGNTTRCEALRQQAAGVLNGDAGEFTAIVEENRFSFTTVPPLQPEPSKRVRMGFAD